MIRPMEEKQVKYPLGTISRVEAVTFGEPGRRTFRMDLHSGPAFCSLWLEKEQLFQLGTYLKDTLASSLQRKKLKRAHPRNPVGAAARPPLISKQARCF